MPKPGIIIIVGPTAVGKSAVAMNVAEAIGGEIVSADSMQIYRYMDIGTAKPSLEERKKVRHHMLDIRDPDAEFNAASYREEASSAIKSIHDRGQIPIVSGGTGLYIKALTEGIFDAPDSDREIRERLGKEAEISGIESLHARLRDIDPISHKKIDPKNRHRVIRALEIYYITGRPMSSLHDEHAFSERPYDILKIGLTMERERLFKNIDYRVECMIQGGFIQEVRSLLERGCLPCLKPMRSIGYLEICRYLGGEIGLDEAISLMKRNTRHYAKRQLTWFRRDESIEWHQMEKEGVFGEVISKARGFAGRHRQD